VVGCILADRRPDHAHRYGDAVENVGDVLGVVETRVIVVGDDNHVLTVQR
jgi:hypothetical protein